MPSPSPRELPALSLNVSPQTSRASARHVRVPFALVAAITRRRWNTCGNLKKTRRAPEHTGRRLTSAEIIKRRLYYRHKESCARNVLSGCNDRANIAWSHRLPFFPPLPAFLSFYLSTLRFEWPSSPKDIASLCKSVLAHSTPLVSALSVELLDTGVKCSRCSFVTHKK